MANTIFTDGVTLTDDEWFNHVNDAVYEVMGDGTTPPSIAVAAMKNLFKKGADIASAATVNLAAATGNYIHVTGAVTITSFGTVNAGVPFMIVFDGALTLTHNATSLILLSSANRVTTSGSVGIYVSEGSGNWREISYGTNQVNEQWDIENLTLLASVSANALTVAIKTKSANDPSSTDPIFIKFRQATLTDGTYVVRTLSAASSIVVSSGSTLGTVSGVAARLYVGVADDGGTLRPFIYNPYNATGPILTALNEGGVYSSTAEGGAGAADSAQVLYSGTAFSAKAIRLLGYIEISEATAGTWATDATVEHVLKVGDHRTGDLVQTARSATGEVATGTTTIPIDDSIPQITEGDQYMSQSITPTGVMNLLRITSAGTFASTSAASNDFIIALFQDTTANALVSAAHTSSNSANIRIRNFLDHLMRAGTTSSTTFRIRAGIPAGGTTTFNGSSSARLLGGVNNSHLTIEEIFA